MFQPALHIHFTQSVTSMTQKETIRVFSGNRKLGEDICFFLFSLAESCPLIVVAFLLCLLFFLLNGAVSKTKFKLTDGGQSFLKVIFLSPHSLQSKKKKTKKKHSLFCIGLVI